jgi:predicted nucleotidyltransferase
MGDLILLSAIGRWLIHQYLRCNGTNTDVNSLLLHFPQRNDRNDFMEPNEITSEIDNIVEQIIQKYYPLKIILFGSAGRGEYDKVNDLDFLIIKQDVPSYGLARMRELDELIDRNLAADMLVYRPDEFEERVKLGDPFIKTILKEGKVLYG